MPPRQLPTSTLTRFSDADNLNGGTAHEPGTPNGTTAVSQPGLWQHQKEAVAKLAELADIHGGAVLDMGMGTGKTRTMLALLAQTADRNGSLPVRVLLVAPNSALGVWETELGEYIPGRFSFIRRRGSSPVARFAEQVSEALASPDDLMVATTYDQIRNKALLAVLQAQRWTAVVCDESHRLKNSMPKGSQISRIMAEDNWNIDRRWAMSGTTHPRSLLELHGQIRFASPGWLPHSWNEFVREYATISERRAQLAGSVVIAASRDRRTYKVATPTQEFRVKLGEADAPIWIAPPADQLVDLPSLMVSHINCEMSAAARKIYDSLDATGTAELPTGEKIDTRTQGARDWTAQALLSVASGHLGSWEDEQASKFEALADLIDSLPPEEKIVVFCHQRAHHEQIKQSKKWQTETIIGGMTVEQRTATVQRWEQSDTQVLTYSPSIAEGVSLVAARYAVFFSLPWQPQAMSQATARLHRAGQKRNVHITSLLATNRHEKTIDHAQHTMLERYIAANFEDNQSMRDGQDSTNRLFDATAAA